MNIEQKTNTGTRIGSMLIDYMAMSFIAVIFFIPGMIISFFNAFNETHEQSGFNLFGDSNYIALIGFAVYFCKDCINGRSIGKRILKLQVVNNSNGRVAAPIRCFIRNIFIIVWPIEAIATLINPSRRIGDFLAGTKVVPFNPEHEQPKINYVQIAIALILAYGIMLLIMSPFYSLKSKIDSKQVTYIESSINKQSAIEMEKTFTDSLNGQLTSSVLVYDQIKQNEDLKYVSVIIHLNDNYLDNDEDYEQIKAVTLPLLYNKFEEGTFVGKIKYVYKQPSRMQTRILHLDWRDTK